MLPLDCCRVLISIHASALFFNASVFFNEKVRAREREIESEWVKREDEKAAKTNQMMILRTKERVRESKAKASEQTSRTYIGRQSSMLKHVNLSDSGGHCWCCCCWCCWKILYRRWLIREQNRKKKKKWSAVVLMHRGLQFEAGWLDSSAADASGCCCCLSDGVRCTNTDTQTTCALLCFH